MDNKEETLVRLGMAAEEAGEKADRLMREFCESVVARKQAEERGLPTKRHRELERKTGEAYMKAREECRAAESAFADFLEANTNAKVIRINF